MRSLSPFASQARPLSANKPYPLPIMPLLPHPLEPLEARIAPATFTVIVADDAGAGSFRQALLEANANAGSDTITFNIPGAGVQTISLVTALPAITDTAIIDGTTQPGFVAGSAPRIELTGAALGLGANGLEVAATGVQIAALTINHFAGAGIVLRSSGGTIVGSYIGTDSAGGGTGTPGNGTGVFFDTGASGNRVGGLGTGAGNLISRNLGDGIATSTGSLASGNVISGNRIFFNVELGIDIFNDGVTPNIAGHQAFPVIDQALIGGGRTILRGTLTSTPSSVVAIQFFSTFIPDATGFGEGNDYLGTAGVSTDAAGLATFSVSFDAEVVTGASVTAVAIDAVGNTSEFSLARLVTTAAITPSITADGRTATFTDVDGDRVTVRTSKGRFDPADFTIRAGTAGGGQLQLLDLHDDAGEFAGADITITAQRTPTGGDGFVNVGYLDSTGFDLGNVRITGDLGRIDAGDAATSTPGLKSLTLHSLGRFLGYTQALPADLGSTVIGTLGKATIATDVTGASLLVTGNLHALTIGGSLIGGSDTTVGALAVNGTLGKVRIAGDIIGGSASESGTLFGTFIKDLSLGGSIIGGTAANSGAVFAGTGGIGKLSIGDRVVGNPTATGIALNGAVIANGRIGSLNVAHNLLGGASTDSGYIFGAEIGSVTIGGILRGGTGERSGSVQSNSSIGATKILGSLLGGNGATSGSIFAVTGIASISVSHSLEGGGGTNSGSIVTSGSLGAVKVGGGLQRGSGDLSGSISALTHIASVDVKGNVFAGISTLATIGSVKIGRDFAGLLSARGNTGATTAAAALAIASVSIGGSFDGSIFAGYDHLADTWTNPDVQIGAITVGRNASLARISAGVNPGPNFQFADGDDFVVLGGNALVSQIASITVKGQVGGFATGEHFGFTAQQIGKLQIGGVKFPLTSGTDRFDLGTLGNISLREA